MTFWINDKNITINRQPHDIVGTGYYGNVGLFGLHIHQLSQSKELKAYVIGRR